ncbi:hypothetical protein [Streptomyces sp. NPDC093089]|uniref:hypothetical protein n=1 Tax=Streptomyces sp. NPDC093089 TaxID=3366024 RepID=UPI00380C0506
MPRRRRYSRQCPTGYSVKVSAGSELKETAKGKQYPPHPSSAPPAEGESVASDVTQGQKGSQAVNIIRG